MTKGQKCILEWLDETLEVCRKIKERCPNDIVFKNITLREGFHFDEITLIDAMQGLLNTITTAKEKCVIQFLGYDEFHRKYKTK